MNRFVVLVDAGYLLSQSVQALSNMKSKARKDVSIHDPQGLISMITSNASAALGGNTNLLRVYWYDGVYGGRMSNEQEALALLPDVQLRSGIVNRSGVQKGIDSKMMVDLMELSTNQAISDAVLLTGDGDLVIAIEWAQRRGVRVALMGIEEANGAPQHNQSFEALCMADRVRRIGRSDIAPFLSYTSTTTADAAPPASPTTSTATKGKAAPAKKTTKAQAKVPAPAKTSTAAAAKKPAAPKAPQAANDSVLSAIVDRFIESAVPPFTRATVTPSGAIGQSIDGKLLQAAMAELGRNTMPAERKEMRKILQDRLLALPDTQPAELI